MAFINYLSLSSRQTVSLRRTLFASMLLRYLLSSGRGISFDYLECSCNFGAQLSKISVQCCLLGIDHYIERTRESS